MNVVAVTGTGDQSAVARRLVERLDGEGSVGTVTRSGSDPVAAEEAGGSHHNVGSHRHYRLGSDSWTASGNDSRLVTDVLDELAPRCEYAVIDGVENPAVPTVVVGDGEAPDGRILERVPSKEEFDPDAIVDELAETDPYETLESLVARAKESPDSDRAGAIATFTGRVRARDDGDDPATEYLEFERYDELAEEKMAAIREELEQRNGVFEVILHHRTGVVEAEEDIVFVVVLAGHRPEAFATVEDGINRLKAEVPLFKKEVTVEGTFWAHQHDHEHGDEATDGTETGWDGEGTDSGAPEPTPDTHD
jgi:molybdopterin synthase catalytic subunit